MNNDLHVLLKVILDSGDIGSSDIARIRKILKKYTIQIPAELDTARLRESAGQALGHEIDDTVKEAENSLHGLQRLGASLKDRMSQTAKSFNQALSQSAVVTFLSKIKNAALELKDVNRIMTQIGKTTDRLSKADLSAMEKSSYATAGKYGKKASDYLAGVRSMYRAGYQNAEDLAELSMLAQAAGDMDAGLADNYLTAVDAAYKLKGNAQALNAVLDGQSSIAGRNALSMEDLAQAAAAAASRSAASGVALEKTTAAMGAMIAVTRQGGDAAARAWDSILIHIRQAEGETADGEILDAESLRNYEQACQALGVSLREVKGGVLSLRDPMQILQELSQAYAALDESDARRAGLISAAGGKNTGIQLDALLENWTLYEKMLTDYAQGSGSAMEAAMKSADSWEGSLNRLGNTFAKVMGNIVHSDAVAAAANGFNGLLSIIDHVTAKLGSLGSMALGAGLLAGLKNVGRWKNVSPVCCLF